MSFLKLILEKIKEQEETQEDYYSRIRFNKQKKKLLNKGILRIGTEKQFYGPHEEAPTIKVIPLSFNPPQISEKSTIETSDSQRKEALRKVIKLTPGIKNSIKGYTCKNCGFPIPKYRGRYPNDCINCGEQLEKKELK